MQAHPILSIYLYGWLLVCALALILACSQRRALARRHAGYMRFILQRWKWLSAALATTSFVLIAPYTGDPTWDYADALFMSVLTFLSAPWAVGILWRACRRQAVAMDVFLAVVCWLFSASWSYDGYLVLRDGDYPETWLSNLYLSSLLYCSAGILWNLCHDAGRGLHFAFVRPDWLASPAAPFSRLLWLALPLMLLAGAMIAYFPLTYL
ncbi:hypothetical protein [Chitinilyticum piscinae]|uniref:Uncharacterized protein n=1 Tax=Chitinilyticum piscinae TaxID=2866724 RepID=A0A8J7K0V7_9NEIS|nr:hypothetical protein [Chitinilyticum piscinae]MBE9608441.1 hypothetical protein [Chitinilyticum piscinae]